MESMPTELPLAAIPGTRSTAEVLTSWTNEARHKIDVTAMYWSLLKNVSDPGNRNFTAEQYEHFGRDKGVGLFEALRAAAKRGVQIRVLGGAGISSDERGKEIDVIIEEYPSKVALQLYNASAWYPGGIMHQKFWIFDTDRAVVTSANMDWLSLAQVKELGVAVDDRPDSELVADLQKYFDRWWVFTDPKLPPCKKSLYDRANGAAREVPCFSQLYGAHDTMPSPFHDSLDTEYNLDHQMKLKLNGTTGGTFLSCSPPELCDSRTAVDSRYQHSPPGRQWDGDALSQTILSAHDSVSLSVMDFSPTSYYEDATGVWWELLSDALVTKIRAGTNVRVLISRWAHSDKRMFEFLRTMNTTAQFCANAAGDRAGTFAIRLFEVPGWEKTTGPDADYPAFSRVNHAKYIVTDNRFNIGTSNMEWSYFFDTAGTSFNSDHAGLRKQVQAIFDRDWNSPFAVPLKTVIDPIDGVPSLV